MVNFKTKDYDTTRVFNILFWLKVSYSKNGKAPLYARITGNGKWVELSLKRKLPIANWDSSKNKLKWLSNKVKPVNSYVN